MKQLILLFHLLTVCIAFGQQTFTSPYIYAEQTFTLEIPKGFYLIQEGDKNEPFLYSKDKNATTEILQQQPTCDALVITYDYTTQSIEELFANSIERFETVKAKDESIQEPTLVTVNGLDCIQSTIRIQSKYTIPAMSITQFIFGDYMVTVAIAGIGKNAEKETPELARTIISSFATLKTDAKSAWNMTDEANDLQALMDALESLEDDEVIDHGYGNSLFPTQFGTQDIFLMDTSETSVWRELEIPDMRLLIGYTDEFKEGTVKVFSGGSVADYPTLESAIPAIKKVIEGLEKISLIRSEDVDGMMGSMKKHIVSSNLNIPCFYTTVINGELLFFIVEQFSDQHDVFKSGYEKLITSLYFIIEEE